MDAALVGAAGVYFVAAQLSASGLQCALTLGNAPNVDILVSDLAGSASVSLQVKTAVDALRWKGQGDEKKRDHYEWSIGWKCVDLCPAPNLLFALVDLKGFGERPDVVPDVFIVPSQVIADYFFGPNCSMSRGWWKEKTRPDRDQWKWARYHELVAEVDQYKNNWVALRDRLAELKRGAG